MRPLPTMHDLTLPSLMSAFISKGDVDTLGQDERTRLSFQSPVTFNFPLGYYKPHQRHLTWTTLEAGLFHLHPAPRSSIIFLSFGLSPQCLAPVHQPTMLSVYAHPIPLTFVLKLCPKDKEEPLVEGVAIMLRIIAIYLS